MIYDYFQQAELSLAAYAQLSEGMSAVALAEAVQQGGKGMSPKQAEEFAKTWRVVDQYTHSEVWTWTDELGNETQITGANGLSVTLFENVETGKRYVAVRGTDDLNDIWTDITDIAVLGTPERQAQYADLKSKLDEWLADPQRLQGRSFTVTGHSLGGFLAGALTVDFPAQIEHAYLYNAPGVGGLVAGLRLMLGLEQSPSLNLSSVSNLRADAGVSPIAGLGLAWGTPIAVTIENQFASDVANPPAAFNHSQQVFTDALAVFALYSGLSPALTFEQIGKIVKGAANANSRSLESTLDTLRTLLIDGEIATDTTRQTKTGDREDYYKNLYDLQQNPSYIGLEGRVGITVIADQGSAALADQAKGDFGTFLALNHLLPVALAGASGTLVTAHQTEYNAWHADQTLTTAEKAGGKATYSDAWYTDRAKMLSWVLGFNAADGRPDEANTVSEPWRFTDNASGRTIEVTPNGGNYVRFNQVLFGKDGTSDTASDPLTGDILTDRIYGMGGDDTINGQAGADYLEGGDGNDVLDGGSGDDILVGGDGSDRLEGGEGFDTYYADSGDTIYDSDGQGEIYVNGKKLGGAFRDVGGNTFISEDGTELYRDNGDGTFEVWAYGDGDDSHITIKSPPSSGLPRSDIPNVYTPGMGVSLETRDKRPDSIDNARPDAVLNDFYLRAQAFINVRGGADPLVLDLDNDGIETLPLSSTNPILFDIDASGVRTTVGWVKPDDGFLVLDRNGNGLIDSGAELFGDATPLASGGRARNGFDALAQEDTNADGVVNSVDSRWNDLKIWRDLNGDGVSQANEISTLASLDITALNVESSTHAQTLGDGNRITDIGTYVRGDGTTASLGETFRSADIVLDQNTFHSQFIDVLPISEEAATLPNMFGSGRIRSLQEAASVSQQLTGLLQDFSSTTSRSHQMALVDDILYEWSKTSDLAVTFDGAYAGHDLSIQFEGVSPNSEGYDRSYQHWEKRLSILERFNGQTFRPVPSGTDPVTVTLLQGARLLLEQSYQHLRASVYDSLVLDTRLAPLMDFVRFDAGDAGLRLGFSAVRSEVFGRIQSDFLSGVGDLIDFTRATERLFAGSSWNGWQLLNDVLTGITVTPDMQAGLLNMGVRLKGLPSYPPYGGTDEDDVVFGDESADSIYGRDGRDVLIAGGGNDSLAGHGGADVLIGGGGNDALNGGAGDDTYYFRPGDGSDTIEDWDNTIGNVDTIRLLGVRPADVVVSRSPDSRGSKDLVVTLTATGERIYVRYQFESDDYGIERIVFDDGTVWDSAAISSTAIKPTEAGGVSGTSGSDTFDLRSAVSNTTNGYGGSDTYIFGIGSGQDTIYDPKVATGETDTLRVVGVAPSQVTLVRPGVDGWGRLSSDLVVSINGTSDQVTIQNQFEGSGSWGIERVVFDDGTVWTSADLDLAAIDLRKSTSEGISRSSPNVNDTYLFGLGSGRDTISDYDTNAGNLDKVRLQGVLPSDVSLTRVIDGYNRITNDLVVSINGTTDSLTIQNHFSDAAFKIEQVVFDDGTVWTVADLDAAGVITPTTAGGVSGTSGSDTFDLRNGVSNTAYGYSSSGWNSGNDTYLFGAGAGQDTINDFDSATGNIDTVKLVGLTPSQVTLVRELGSNGTPSSDLLIRVVGTTDSLRIRDYFYATTYKIEKLVFGDGTTWGAAEMDAAPFDFTGPASNAVIRGSGNANGNDTYLFGAGSGQDVINDNDSTAGNIDTVKLVELTPSQVTLVRELGSNGTPSSDLLIRVVGTTDSLRIRDYFYATTYKIEKLVFGDGTTWGATEMDAAPFDFTGPASNAVIRGSGNANGNDTYLFGAGSGQDVINDNDSTAGNVDTVKLVELTPSQVTLVRELGSNGTPSSDLLIRVVGTTDSLRIRDYFYATTYKIEKLVFGDGTTWGAAEMDAAPFDFTGPASNAVIRGSGNANGNDTYLFGAGSGQDVINDNDSTAGNIDTVKLVGLTPSQVTLVRELGSNGVLTSDLLLVVDSTGDTLRIRNYFSSDDYKIEKLVFGNGTVLDATQIANHVLVGTAEVMTGTAGNDTFVVDSSGDTILEGANQGTDTVRSSISWTLGDNLENLTLIGSASINGVGNQLNNVIIGNTAINVIDGGAGNDVLNGGSGNDTLRGGLGSDSLYGESGADVLEGDAAGALANLPLESLVVHARGSAVDGIYPTMEVWVDGVKLQTFTVNSATYTAYEVSLPAGLSAREVAVVFTNDASKPELGQDRNLYVDQIVVNGQAIKGTGTGVVLDIGSGAGAFDGLNTYPGYGSLTGNGSLRFGLTGADLLDGGTGVDVMRGGIGNDAYAVDDAGDVIEENADAGFDVVRSSVSYTLSANVENLHLQGTANIDGTGNGGQNMLVGNSGANRLDGGQGKDMMVGGLGDDVYVVSDAGDIVWEAANQGTDLVQSSVSYTLGSDVENLTLTGTAAINGTGNVLANLLEGNAGANTLRGGSGNDTLRGGLGSDSLYGEAGADVLEGDAAGALANLPLESLVVHARGSAVDGIYPTMEVWVDGVKLQTFTVNSATYTAYEVSLPAGLSAREVAVVFTNDASKPELGQDRNLYVDQIVVNGQPIKGTGTGVVLDIGSGAGAFDGLNTYPGYGSLTGNGSLRFGLTGADLLDGGTGVDVMRGGIGNDAYAVDDAGDVIEENADAGFDVVRSSVSYTLSANVENLHLQGTANIDGTGNGGQNMLVGNSGANRLDGGQGKDMMVGGLGDDVYQFGIGYGQETVYESDATAGNSDSASFLSGIATDQLWFRRSGNNLEVSIIGTSDRILIDSWYSGTRYHIEQFKTADGKTLVDSKVESLVQAMAAFSPPAAGQTTLPSNYQTALQPVLAANWQ